MACFARQEFQLFFITIISGVTSMVQTNLFYWSGAFNGVAWGRICFDFADYTPTCGWQIIATCEHPLASFQEWDNSENITRVNDYTFILTNKADKGDFSSSYPACGGVTVQGTFGNRAPTMCANFYCVCTSSTCEGVPYTTCAPTTISTSISTSTSTSKATSISTSTSESAPAPTLYPGQTEDNPTQIYLNKITNVCYIGTSKTALEPGYTFVECCSLCIYSNACAGVNFRDAANQCDLVHANSNVEVLSFQSISGCQYWDVVWKK